MRRKSIPATESADDVTISQFPLQCSRPTFTICGIAAVYDSPVQPVQICTRASYGCVLRSIATSMDGLARELRLGDAKLPVRNEVPGGLIV